MYGPVAGRGKFDAARRTKCLRNCILQLFNAPRSEVFSYGADAEALPNLLFDTAVGRGVVILADDRTVLLVARAPAGDESCF